MAGISIIIITYNRPEDTLALLECLRQFNHQEQYLREIILLNNASTVDYTAVSQFAAQQPGWPLRLMDAPENLGVSRGRNYAAAKAEGNILLFLDDDVLIEDRELLPKVAGAFKHEVPGGHPLGVICCKVLYAENREMQVNAFPHKQFEGYRDKSFFLTSYYVGCAHAILHEAWRKAGPYPEDFFYGMEEYDESYRLLDAGYRIAYDASLVILHKESPQGRKPRAEQLQHMWLNKSKVARKYLPGIYFITTAVAWSVFFLRRSGYDWKRFFSGWSAVAAIPRKLKPQRVGTETKRYLRSVKARLWF
ncbi:glycosyltransferase family 2 protein [Flavihumibacter petaseus]|uniref:Putative glycosyltransferase n=1 Tax=Flavihumibacter petaseus NBRC 106054 TaxID=1220578 RepID=A0A0E9N1R1_9BACT|nr:glycosyltransferase family 2 protein [Flavihumibacter petaseus]GAO43713.1 putative glycosyltransferase [Flavihumibacter petaseus NBRC 106054]